MSKKLFLVYIAASVLTMAGGLHFSSGAETGCEVAQAQYLDGGTNAAILF